MNLSSKEKIAGIISVKEFKKEYFLLMATQKGLIKRCSLDLFSNLRKNGIIAITLDKEDDLIGASLVEGSRNGVILSTENGKAIRFKDSQIRPTGRTSQGVKGITLSKNDKVLGMVIVTPSMKQDNASLFTITENGFSKRTFLKEYRVQSRAGKGIIGAAISSKTGKVSATILVVSEDEIMVISQKGILIRCKAETIRASGRATQGVKFIKLDKGDSVASVARIAEND